MPYQITLMSPLSRMAGMDQMKKRLSSLDQWLVLRIHLMNPKPSTHGDMSWGWASQGYYPKVMTSSSLKVTGRSNQLKILKVA